MLVERTGDKMPCGVTGGVQFAPTGVVEFGVTGNITAHGEL